MDILIKNDVTKQYENLGTHRYVEVNANGLDVLVTLASGRRAYCGVLVQNASHHAWRGMGREFATLDAARAHYRDKRVTAALTAVAAILAEGAANTGCAAPATTEGR